ncbi:MAG: PQQ-binding-like beta-propeller repeat protein [Verrucomicrobiota bacterium]
MKKREIWRTVVMGLLCHASITSAQEPFTERFRLRPSNVFPPGNFSQGVNSGVDVQGDRAIVGAFNEQARPNLSNGGAAYIFDATTGQELHRLIAGDASSRAWFGISVRLDAGLALVGSPLISSRRGAVYLFDVESGSELLKLTASDRAANDKFGRDVAISGNRILVGATGDDDRGSDTGAAYLFETSTGTELRKLLAVDSVAGDNVGGAVAASASLGLVGAPGHDQPAVNSGAVYVFDLVSGQELRKLTPSNPVAQRRFGSRVDLDGSIAIISGDRGNAVYLFDVRTGQELANLAVPAEVGPADLFGSDVRISGDLAVIGAAQHDLNGERDRGVFYIYDIRTGAQVARHEASDGMAEDRFGDTLGIDEGVIVAGASFAEDLIGAAYIFSKAMEIAIPTMGEWTLLSFVLLLMTMGTIVIERRRRAVHGYRL